MATVEKTVFISYRRTNIGYALAIYQELSSRGFDVFFDFNSIGSGDFEQIILNNIESRAHFLVLLTPSALERLAEPKDWLRKEIEFAIDTKRNIVPLVFDNFDWQLADIYLTGKLSILSHYNSLRIPPDFFTEAMERLVNRFLNIPVLTFDKTESLIEQKASTVELDMPVLDDPNLPHVFLSYSRKNSDIMTKVKNHLINDKIKVWTDEGIEPGTPSWQIAIENALESCLCFIPLMSPHSKKSEWVRLETSYAKDFGKPNIPVLIKGNSKTSVPIGLYNHQRIDVTEPNNFEAGMKKLSETIHSLYEYIIVDIKKSTTNSSPMDAQDWFEKALFINSPKEKIVYYSTAIELEPNFANAYNNRSAAYRIAGELNKSIQDATKAIELKPSFAEAFNNRGSAYIQVGNMKSALSDFSEAIQLKPDLASAYYNRGAARKQQGKDIQGAIYDYQKYLDLGGGNRDGDQNEVEQIIRNLKKKL